jgi:hypothetical protein
MSRSSLVVFAVVVFFFALPSDAGTLLVNQQDPYSAHGYGLSDWDSFSAIFDAQFGAANITVQTSNLTGLLAYDSLMVVLTDLAGAHPVLDATEIANLQAFIAAGRRVLLLGDNGYWSDWNNSILSAVGGSFAGDLPDVEGDLAPVLVHPLTAGVSLLRYRADGLATGGTSLFDQNLATLWGAGQNTLSLLSCSLMHDDYIGISDNTAFVTNTAAWLDGEDTGQVPEPASYLLVGLGAALVAIRKLR